MSDISQIDGHAVRLQRETLGWATTDLATLACTPEGLRLIDMVEGLSHSALEALVGLPIAAADGFARTH